MFNTRTTCRVCGGSLTSVFNLGDVYVSTFVDTADSDAPKVPLELVLCNSCLLVQLKDTVDGSVMYSDYWYKSGLNKSMVSALGDVVHNAIERTNALALNDLVLDIGANDGTLLRFYPGHLTRVGFEPSNLYALGEGPDVTIIHDYFNKEAFERQFPGRYAKIITAIAMFYDLEDPHTFVEDLRECLDKDGVIVIQLMDLLSMLRTNDFPNLCHEHLEYYSLANLVWLFAVHSLQIFDVEYNTVNGGSLRIYVRHEGNDAPLPTVNLALTLESMIIGNVKTSLNRFARFSEMSKNAVCNFIRDAQSRGSKVAVMGASTKGNTILQYYGLTGKDIDHAGEINADKYGKLTIGSNIPIISDSDSLAKNPEYYLILPWGFTESFIRRYNDYLRAGGQFIVPLPWPELICYNGDTLCRYPINEDGSTTLQS